MKNHFQVHQFVCVLFLKSTVYYIFFLRFSQMYFIIIFKDKVIYYFILYFITLNYNKEKSIKNKTDTPYTVMKIFLVHITIFVLTSFVFIPSMASYRANSIPKSMLFSHFAANRCVFLSIVDLVLTNNKLADSGQSTRICNFILISKYKSQ